MNKFLSSAFLLLTASASTYAALPVGTFGHEFTSTKDAPVWSVQVGAGSYKVLNHGDGKKKKAHILTTAERFGQRAVLRAGQGDQACMLAQLRAELGQGCDCGERIHQGRVMVRLDVLGASLTTSL